MWCLRVYLYQYTILDFRSYWPVLKEIANNLIIMTNQLSLLTRPDFYWPGAIGPVLKSQTVILVALFPLNPLKLIPHEIKVLRPKLSICLFPCTRLTIRRKTLQLATPFFLILVTGIHDQKFPILLQNLRSELVYTVLYDQNPLLDLGRNQSCVAWMQYFCSLFLLSDIMSKFLWKNPTSYRPIGELEGQVQETSIFSRVVL